MLDYWKKHKYSLLFIIASILFYFSFGYDLERTDFIKLISLYIALFYFFYKIIVFEKSNFLLLLIFGITVRLVFIGATPNLSQDFYRFIWDGKLILNDINPYLQTPNELISKDLFSSEVFKTLYNGMGNLSASHYSNYPPVNQLLFFLSAFFGGESILGNIITLRLFIILADIGTLYFGLKIISLLKLPKHQIFWYILNPFIVIELTGNLHFEGVMLFFLVAALYFILKNKWILGAVLIAISISVKLLPLLLLPLFLRWFIKDSKQLKASVLKLTAFYFIVGIGILATFLPFISSELINNYSATIGLWFRKFEFNASIYYIVREIGFYTKGYNIIETAGFRMAVTVLLFIISLAIFRKNNQPLALIVSMLMAVTFYFFMSTTVHPWYIATPLILCVFTNYKYPIIWSLVVALSYYAYSQSIFKENLWIVAIEYIIIYSYFLLEVFIKKPLLKHL